MVPVVDSMLILMNLPNLDELSFFNVLALPKDSRRGLDDNTLSSSEDIALLLSA